MLVNCNDNFLKISFLSSNVSASDFKLILNYIIFGFKHQISHCGGKHIKSVSEVSDQMKSVRSLSPS